MPDIKYIFAGLVGLALLGLSIAVWVQTERANTANARADVEAHNAVQWKQDYEGARDAAAANAKALDEYKAKAAASDKIADDTRKEIEKRDADLSQLKKELAHASAQDDGPIAPVLRYVLQRLRRASPDTACAANDHPEGGRVSACPHGTVVVRSATGSP